jgi:two-component system sensor histidine kinase YesM
MDGRMKILKAVTLRKYFRKMPFRYKLAYYLIMTICITVFIVVCFSYTVTSRSIMKQARDMTMQQLEQNTLNLQNFIEHIERLPDTIVTDNNLQYYLSKEDENTPEFTSNIDNVYKSMSNILVSNRDILYICVYKALNNKLLYLGPSRAGKKSDYSEMVAYLMKYPIAGNTIRVSFRNDPIITDRYTLAVCQPIFDKYAIKKPLGMLRMSVEEEALTGFYSQKTSKLPLETFIMDGRGVIVSHIDKNKISTDAGLHNIINKEDGAVELDGKLVVYKYFSNWDWYVIGTLPVDYLLRDNNLLLMGIILIVLITISIATFISFGFSRHLLKPFDELIYRMSRVSVGDFTTRINLTTYDRDFEQVSEGFNIMVEQINTLMNRIYEEQRQLKEIEFKALQAQIDPHFLYNTLESVHMQALLAGQHDISKMVRALAGFYRISLSRGEDVIPLKSESEHVENYMIIQELRYSDKIECYIDIPEEFREVRIPKMTLQPLVENTIYHGLKDMKSKGFIKITAIREGDGVVVKVIDNCAGMKPEQIRNLNRTLAENDNNVGYGVRNVHRRIELLFGSPYGLFYEINEFGGVTVNVRLPMHAAALNPQERVVI